MHICIIGEGQLIHIQNRTKIFAERGHDVTLVTEKPSGLDNINEIIVSPSNHRIIYAFDSIWQHLQVLRQIQADVFHVHFARRSGAWAAAIANVHPLVVSLQGADAFLISEGKPVSRFQRMLTMNVLASADAITTQSNYVSEAIKQYHYGGASPVFINWGIDLTLFKKVDIAALHGRFSNQYVLFYPKSLKPFYNAHLIIEALPQILKPFPQTVLILVRSNPDHEYEKTLHHRIQELGISGHVQFIEPLPPHEMVSYYNLSDIVFNIPMSDALPRVFLESLACETVCILGNLPQYTEYVDHLSNGYVADLTPDSLAQATIKLLGDEDLRAQIIQNGKTFVTAFADAQREAEKVENMYAQLNETVSVRKGTPQYGVLSKAIFWGLWRLLDRRR